MFYVWFSPGAIVLVCRLFKPLGPAAERACPRGHGAGRALVRLVLLRGRRHALEEAETSRNIDYSFLFFSKFRKILIQFVF